MSAPAVDSRHTAGEREAERQRIRDEWIRRADELGRSLVCTTGRKMDSPSHHEQCAGPASSGRFGCLCECHDADAAAES